MNELEENNLLALETEIKVLKGQAVQNIIEVGKRLIKAKELVPHGKWGEWLDTKVDFSERQAQRLIQVAREFPNPTSVAGLSQTKIFKLLSIPSDERGVIICIR